MARPSDALSTTYPALHSLAGARPPIGPLNLRSRAREDLALGGRRRAAAGSTRACPAARTVCRRRRRGAWSALPVQQFCPVALAAPHRQQVLELSGRLSWGHTAQPCPAGRSRCACCCGRALGCACRAGSCGGCCSCRRRRRGVLLTAKGTGSSGACSSRLKRSGAAAQCCQTAQFLLPNLHVPTPRPWQQCASLFRHVVQVIQRLHGGGKQRLAREQRGSKFDRGRRSTHRVQHAGSCALPFQAQSSPGRVPRQVDLNRLLAQQPQHRHTSQSPGSSPLMWAGCARAHQIRCRCAAGRPGPPPAPGPAPVVDQSGRRGVGTGRISRTSNQEAQQAALAEHLETWHCWAQPQQQHSHHTCITVPAAVVASPVIVDAAWSKKRPKAFAGPASPSCCSPAVASFCAAWLSR